MIRLCRAKAKSTKKPCQRIACKNGRCHLHGGKSTGPKTEEGRMRIKKAQTKHGYYTKEAIEKRKAFRQFLKETRQTLKSLNDAACP